MISNSNKEVLSVQISFEFRKIKISKFYKYAKINWMWPSRVALVLNGVKVDGVVRQVIFKSPLHKLVQGLTVKVVGKQNGNFLKNKQR